MCDEAADDSLASLKVIPDWFVTSKMITKFYTALYADDNIIYFHENSDEMVFSCNNMNIFSIDLNNIYLDNNFDEYDPDTFILIRISPWHTKFEKGKTLK